MDYYLAPLEGITGWVFRKAFYEVFGEGIDRYYSPFIVPHEKKALTNKDIANISPVNNAGMRLIPQVLTNSAAGYLSLEKEIAELGYDQVNLNIGCPSKTVSSKGRGAGFLKTPEKVDAFLEEVFDGAKLNVSVKTRIGWESEDEWAEILDIYNKYPICELIIHPRTGVQFYKGQVHFDSYLYAKEHAKMPLCFNGDVKCKGDLERISDVPAVMIGRGLLERPGFVRAIRGGEEASVEEIRTFLGLVEEGYYANTMNETQVLFKMKELWTFLKASFPDREREIKKIMKSKRRSEYENAVRELLG